ncbi:AMP-dependent synthetase/ligase [Mucilaginibacter flavidus]|uniref:AMP-dependent synthetase/ligase n=1 Tax=Mucilaginibacter flavidus TaxID=2949309 RepID=UPI0020925B39|nr:long-chain fatty acid--CoA ligase [Mucilaginibacter flavidus]MCO5948235.1 long-chain fatty acid--CoA ligase [Mucilaginibacter flavidus]
MATPEKALRLFDCMAMQAKEPRPDLLNAKVNGVWQSYSTQQVHDMTCRLAVALLKSGISSGDGSVEGRDKIGLISNGRPEWIITDLAVQQTGAVLVPLYPNTNAKEIEQILIEAEVKVMFISNKELYEKVSSIRNNIPSLKAIYTFDQLDGCSNWSELLKPVTEDDRLNLSKISDHITEDDITTIIYTSGTTGRPKGVMLTHKNILSNAMASGDVLEQIPIDNKRAFSFLPVNHIFEKMCSYIYLFFGFSIYYAESMDTIGQNIKEVHPYIFTAVPRVLEKVFEKIIIEGKKLTGIKSKIFLWSIKIGDQFEIGNKSIWYRTKLAIVDKLVFSKWRAALGGNVKAIVVGSSACPVRLERLFTAAGIVILEGYGLTETSPVISVNQYLPEKRKFGTVGPLLTGVQVKIADDGEILCKGPNVMPGYYKNQELTAEVLHDGWFCTGDIGELDKDSFLKITDRKKEIFKTSGGKYVAPLPIENKMKENYFIEQMMVVGAGKKFASALIVPSYANLKPWCRKNNVPDASNEEMIKDNRVIAMYQSIIDGYNPEFNHVEQIKKFTMLTNEWTVESGELTPTGKMRRKIITEKYNSKIEEMYGDQTELVSTPDK